MYKSFGEFLLDVIKADRDDTGRVAKRIQQRTASGMSEAVPSDGGFLIPPQFVPRLIERIYNTGDILSRCLEMPMTFNDLSYSQYDESSRADGSRMGGVKSYWANEADAATATKPKTMRSTLTAKKIISLVYLTDELSTDTMSPATVLENLRES